MDFVRLVHFGGTSQTVVIPKKYWRLLEINLGDYVMVTCYNDTLVLKRVPPDVWGRQIQEGRRAHGTS